MGKTVPTSSIRTRSDLTAVKEIKELVVINASIKGLDSQRRWID